MARAASTTTSYLHELRLITMRRWFFLRLLRQGEGRGAVGGGVRWGWLWGGGVGEASVGGTYGWPAPRMRCVGAQAAVGEGGGEGEDEGGGGGGGGGGVRVRVRARVGLGAVVRADGSAARHERGAVDRRRAPAGQGAPAGSPTTVLCSSSKASSSSHRAPGRQPAPVARRVGAREGAVSRLRVRPRPFPLRRATAARLACDRCVTGAPTHPHQGHLPLSPSPDPGNSGAPEQPPNRR